ncbi:MAG: ABC transporter ATP-binding protein [Actinobacteria bacterium]|nr:ABC transporter ATP-binding protein [Actinomycetota bacterium]
MSSEIIIEKLSIKYRSSIVFENVSLDIKKSEFFVLLGPSGCGKTTLLNAIAGFLKPHSGKIYVDGKEVKQPGLDRCVIFQNAESALFPWMTVKENSEFGLKLRNIGSKEERNSLIKKFLKKTNLDGHEAKYPKELSGGMKQRLQLARTLVMNPPIILMDEPFANLDAQTRRLMQLELIEIWRETRNTIFYITHDLREAVILGKRIAVMSRGPKAVIKNIYKLENHYPRDLTTNECNNLLREIEENLIEEVRIGENN